MCDLPACLPACLSACLFEKDSLNRNVCRLLNVSLFLVIATGAINFGYTKGHMKKDISSMITRHKLITSLKMFEKSNPIVSRSLGLLLCVLYFLCNCARIVKDDNDQK